MTGKGFAARWGGEEFILVFDKNDLEDTARYLEQILDKIRAHTVLTEGYEIKITMTLGASEGTPAPIEEIVNSADEKLYYGKQHGRNQVVIKIPEGAESSPEEKR